MAFSTPRRRIGRRNNFIVPHLDPCELNEKRREKERLKLNQNLALFCWRWVLGFAACCEFLAYRFPIIKPSGGGEQEETCNQHWWDIFRRKEEEESTLEHAVEAIVSPWLILLYTLYLLDAFVRAQEMKDRTFKANEKERLLHKGKNPIDPLFTFGITLLFYLSILPTWFWWELGTHFGITGVFTTDLVREAATEYAQYSLGYSIIVYIFKHTSASVKSELKSNIKSYIKSLLPRLTKHAIRHPRKFKRQTKQGYTIIIWIKYLIPIGAHINNSGILGKLHDVWKQFKQHSRERKEKKLRKTLWIRLDSSTKREVAALVIQRNYRSYVSRKWTRLLKLEQEKRDTQMILLVQNAIQKREEQEMEEQEQAISELARIQQRERDRQKTPFRKSVFNPLQSIKGATATDDDDLQRKYQLEAEVQARIQREKDKLMLLRPDSRFVFYCQAIYVLCAMIETAHLVLRPRLRDETRTDSQTEFLRFVFDYSYIVIHCILCFGVFVWFFVGEFDSRGCLIPQSFFSRWIYPGLLLHIVVNPALYEIKQIVKFILRAGPGRSWRWWILFVFPFWKRLHAWWEWHIWMKVVQRENQRLFADVPAKQSTFGRRQSCFR